MVDSTGNRGAREPLTTEEIAAIESMQARLSGNFFDVLGVDRAATPDQVRDAYFQLSRRFHPDVFWRKEIGPFKSTIEAIFRELTMAFDTLSNPRKRIPYEERLAAREGQRTGASGQRYPRAPFAPPGPTSSPQVPRAVSNPQIPVPQAPLVSPNAPVPGAHPPPQPQPQPFGGGRPPATQQPFVSRAPTLGSQGAPFVSGTPTPIAVQPMVPNVRRHPSDGDSHAAAEPTSEELRRREAAARFGGVARAPGRGPMTPTEPRHAPVVPVERQPSQPMVSAVRPSDRPPPPAPATPSRGSAPQRPRISDRPPPMAPPGDPGNSLESLRHQLAERVQQSAGKVQPPGPANAPPVVNLSRAEIETQLAQARQANDIGTLVTVLRRAVAAFPDDEAYKLRLDRAMAAQQDEAADALIEQARRAETARRWDLASQKWSLAAEARPMDITVLLSTAAAILEHGQEHAKAAEFARRATQLNPSSARAHAMLSRIFHEAGRAASARASLETALRLDPSAPEVADMLRRINQR